MSNTFNEMSKVANCRIECLYEVYDRTPNANTNHITIEGSSLRVCLMKLLDIVHMYSEPDDILDEEEETGIKLTPEDILERIESQNGDGCDFIFYIKDEITGELLLDSGCSTMYDKEFTVDDEEEDLWS